MSRRTLMRAAILEAPGGPDALRLTRVPRPVPRAGWVLIRVRAFGLNRSEWFTRRGDSPKVKLPRILGIECVGEVVAAPATTFREGQTVAAMMGGMGREYDGSYAEFTSVPAAHVLWADTTLDWKTLGALPEMLQTVHGSLHVGLEIENAKNLLIRGGTSSIGLTAAVLANARGVMVAASTRSADKATRLRDIGVQHVLVDDGTVSAAARAIVPQGFDRVLELVGTRTLIDSLHAARSGGIVCMTGILGGQWTLPDFQPMTDIPSGVKLTSYAGQSSNLSGSKFVEYLRQVERGELEVPIAQTFPLTEIQEAHRLLDDNAANGKIVVLP